MQRPHLGSALKDASQRTCSLIWALCKQFPSPMFQVQQHLTMTLPATYIQYWPFSMFLATLWIGTTSTEVTFREMEKEQQNQWPSTSGALLMGIQFSAKHVPWDKAAAQKKGLGNDRQNEMVFPMPGRGHKVSMSPWTTRNMIQVSWSNARASKSAQLSNCI